jgi:hypothetical protein
MDKTAIAIVEATICFLENKTHSQVFKQHV